MKRGAGDPKEFDVEMPQQHSTDQMMSDLGAIYRDTLTIDELLLHPCMPLDIDQVRKRHDYFYAPDDILLRSVMTLRKRG